MRNSFLLLPTLGTGLATALPSNLSRSTSKGVSDAITNSPATLGNASFDYIICGGGLTGLTIASRLSEDPTVSVLVIEAGYNNYSNPMVNDVRTYGEAFNTSLAYDLKSTPVEWQGGSRLQLVAGKTLGGSDSLNGASWTKGARSQYDLLPALTGDDSWAWTPFNQHMLKAENFHTPTTEQRDEKGAYFDSISHGYGGPVQVSFGAGMFGGTQLPALETSEKVWQNLTRNSDAASGSPLGATIIPNMVDVEASQNRSSSFTAYAQNQVQERDNFFILTGHRVTEIVWQNGTDKLVAEGVRFQASQNSTVEFIKAKREVLLAAGSLHSPQLLELSGVGDSDILSAAGVDVRLSLSGVGKNMQEQTKSSLYYEPKGNTSFNGSGPASAISYVTAAQLLGSESDAWYNSIAANITAYASALEADGLVANATATAEVLKLQLDNVFYSQDTPAAEIFFTIDMDDNTVGIDLWNLVVFSRGTAHIRSNSSWDSPEIEPSYFRSPLDLAFQTAAAKQSRQVFNTAPLSNCVVSEITPGTDLVSTNATTAVWEDWVKSKFTSVWHYIGTLSMMKQEYGGVVDSRLKVYGIENVRVVDASVLPVQLSAHLSSSLFGIAEKGAAMIKEDWAGK
ncbi:alcohol oxidase [Lecanosticta acicola]|uniref:Alcohol oxidase n=1 Tax=Lecanosticta acicola TaxID=111012 RepID=A0AAI9EDL0_9PEZI|nr:alcohol oxidase [Lecanosticta acicola]